MFSGFLSYTRKCDPRSDGEDYSTVVSCVVPDDSVDISSIVKRMHRGEIIPMRPLSFGDATMDDADITDVHEALKDSFESGLRDNISDKNASEDSTNPQGESEQKAGTAKQ